LASNTLEGFDRHPTRESRTDRASIWSQLRLWTQRMSRGERCAVAATMATTFFLIGVMVVALHLTLRDYVIQIGTWPA
jgi:hypothetical protein